MIVLPLANGSVVVGSISGRCLHMFKILIPM